MLIDDEGYVKPASRESRLVMVQLEPRAEKEPKRSETLRKWKQGQKQNTRKQGSESKWIFLSVSWKHIAIRKGFMAAHAHDIRLKVRRKMSDVIGK